MENQTFRTLTKKRTTNFREDETKLLIQLWGSPQIQNKLYLTHRKEPVMRILAANMQHRGFYRTPDEIKTRIRNLKCLYHRIKRSVQSGAGIGTVDPDWPHYKAMDAILSRQSQKNKDIYKDNVFDEEHAMDDTIKIKQEIEEIDINDDMESYTTNSMGGSEYDEEPISLPPLTPAPDKDDKTSTNNNTLNKLPISSTNSNLSNGNGNNKNATSLPSIPFPLLILNGLPQNQDNKNVHSKDPLGDHRAATDVNAVLKELLDVQKENLHIEKQRLELDRQRLEFERVIGGQLLALAPLFGGVLKTLATSTGDGSGGASGDERVRPASADIFRESKILRSLLDDGVRKGLKIERDKDEMKHDD